MAVVLPLGQASDQRTSAQSAADAAALGAATEIRDDLPRALLAAVARLRTQADLPGLLDGLGCGVGGAAAQRYAAANKADVTNYCYVPGRDQIQVEIRSRQVAANGARAQAKAVARLGPRLGACRLTPPAGGPAPAPPPAPGGPTGSVTVRCGDLALDFAIDGTGLPSLTTSLRGFINQLRPRLVA
jgi:hypothetical protein